MVEIDENYEEGQVVSVKTQSGFIKDYKNVDIVPAYQVKNKTPSILLYSEGEKALLRALSTGLETTVFPTKIGMNIW